MSVEAKPKVLSLIEEIEVPAAQAPWQEEGIRTHDPGFGDQLSNQLSYSPRATAWR